MNKKFKIGNKGGIVTITDKNYLASGGEGAIYVNGNKSYKIYHDPKKCVPLIKIKELALINNPNVVTPEEVIYDISTGDPVGYTTQFVDNAEPLLKYFTKTFKTDNNISPTMIADLVKKMQEITESIHSFDTLIVDYNELNVLVKFNTDLNPFYIDTDSYATPSFKATAIMDSVRDRRVSTLDKNGKLVYNPDIMSDWYSWAILSFYLYTNIHPFRGNHPDYKPKDKQKQFDDNISVFHKGVRVPPSVNNFNVIPSRHRAWFEDVFLNNNRSIPPYADSITPQTVPNTIVLVKGTNKLDVIQLGTYGEDVINVVQYMGVDYVITNKNIYSGNKLLIPLGYSKKTLVIPSSDGTMIMANLVGNTVTFKELNNNRVIDSVSTTDVFSRNGAFYVVTNGKLVEYTFTTLGNKTVPRINEVENISNLSSVIYEGCVIQNLLGKYYFAIPFEKGACISKHIPQLDGYRIIDCKSDRWVTVVMAEKNGQYDRFVLVFKKDYSDFDVRKVEDVAYDTINFTVMGNGLCALLSSPTELELFVSNQKVEVLNDPPFDYTMKLFNTPDGIFFINGNSVHQIKRK